MRILAIDSSSMVATVAVVTDGVLTAEYTINHKKTHSQTLLPMIDEIKKNIDLDMNTVDAIAIAGGPGSYTGLRIGSATAKGFGLALNIPIINIPTIANRIPICFKTLRGCVPLHIKKAIHPATSKPPSCIFEKRKVIVPKYKMNNIISIFFEKK